MWASLFERRYLSICIVQNYHPKDSQVFDRVKRTSIQVCVHSLSPVCPRPSRKATQLASWFRG